MAEPSRKPGLLGLKPVVYPSETPSPAPGSAPWNQRFAVRKALFFKDQASDPPEHLPCTGRCWGHEDGHSAPSVQKLRAGGSTEPKDGSLNLSQEAMSSKWYTQQVRAGQRRKREGGSSLEGQGHHQGLPGGGGVQVGIGG